MAKIVNPITFAQFRKTWKRRKPKLGKGAHAGSNSALQLNRVEDVNNGNVAGLFYSDAAVAIAAGNTKRIINLHDLSAHLLAKIDIAPNSKQKVTNYVVTYWWESTAPFSVYPFITILENGESITPGDYNTDLINSILSSVLGTSNISEYSSQPICHAKRDSDGKFRIKTTFDVKRVANRWLSDVYKKALNETGTTGLQANLIGIFSGIASQSISSYHEIREVYQTIATGFTNGLLG